MMKKKALLASMLVVLLGITALYMQQQTDKKIQKSLITKDTISTQNWATILQNARGSTVSFYGWGGDERVNTWIDTIVSPRMQEKYGLTLKRIAMDASIVVTRLLAEKQQDTPSSIDVIWINGENFYTAKENALLFGSFLHTLPNAQTYLDLNDTANTFDFGVPTDGMEAPWGRAQLVFFGDATKHTLPRNLNELAQWVQKNPGKFTYPALPEFTGGAFVRNTIMQFGQGEKLSNGDLTKKDVKAIAKDGLDFLQALKPYLWREGTTYPANAAQISNMYADGEIDICMMYTIDGVRKGIKEGFYPAGTEIFTLEKGSIANTHFLTIANKSPNVAGALVLINELLSVEMQASKADPAHWGDLSVLSMDRVNTDELTQLGAGKLAGKPLPESHASLIPLIDALWREALLIAP